MLKSSTAALVLAVATGRPFMVVATSGEDEAAIAACALDALHSFSGGSQ